jgi:hypothetical protein
MATWHVFKRLWQILHVVAYFASNRTDDGRLLPTWHLRRPQLFDIWTDHRVIDSVIWTKKEPALVSLGKECSVLQVH